jgi:hypothetical protein
VLQPLGCTDPHLSQHSCNQMRDLTSQSYRFIVDERGASAPQE